MSLTAAPAEPRRGARARKQVDRFEPNGKRRSEDGSDVDSQLSDSDNEAPRRKRKANGTRTARAPKRVKAPRTVPITEVEPAEGFKKDSTLFNALLSPEVALDPLIDDWVHAYQQSAGSPDEEKAAVHELVVFLIRACGLNTDIDEDEAMDLDGTSEAVDRIQEDCVKHNTATYPLIAKTKALRPFKGNLATVISHLIASLQLSSILYEDTESTKHSTPLVSLILAWLSSMSSSPLRAIRHTSTFIGLKINTALCDAAAQVTKDLSVKQRQKEAEAKKSGPAAKKRVKDAEDKVKEAHKHKVRLEEHMTEIFDVIFIHRLRDTDPLIRTDCLRELGAWVKKFPERYGTSTFLNYFVRGSNDPVASARLETVKALASLFSNESLAANASSFILRLAPRLIKMAALDVETSVRINAINVITLIDKTGALQDEMESEREKVARLIFDDEERIRKAAAGFLSNLWEERADQLKSEWKSMRAGKKKRAAKIKEDELEERLQWKALATLLVQTYHALDDANDDPSSSQADLTSIPRTSATTRAEAAADGLWPQLSEQREELADYLLLDHSTSDQDMWLLSDEEEDFMLGVLIACIRKEDKDEDEDEKTQALMAVLPRLLTKHQAEANRVAGILTIPQNMNLSLYLDMRKTPAYEALWDDVSTQFLKHSETAVLEAATVTLQQMLANTTMEASNSQKYGELEEAVFASLREAVDGEDVIGMQLDDDKVALAEAILHRVCFLGRARDFTAAMMDEEGGQSSGWTMVTEFAKRGGLGFKEESKLVATALKIVLLQIIYIVKRFTEADAADEDKVEALKTRRDQALEIFEKFGVNGGRATEPVRQEAFKAFIYLHMLFSGKVQQTPASQACKLEMKMDRQHKLGGAFQAAVDRYASERDEDEDEDELSLEAAQREVIFLELVSAFIGAMRAGVIDVEHAKEPLTHYGRFGTTYDQVVKEGLLDVLRDEGIYNNDPMTVQHVIAQALQSSFSIFLESEDEEAEATLSVARLGASAFVIHGPQFTILKQINPNDVYDFHIQNIKWLFSHVATSVKQQASRDSKDAKARVLKQRARLLAYFRPLLHLLAPVTGRDALRIREALEEAVDSSGAAPQIRASPAYRGYERRLVSIAGKDSELKLAPRKAPARHSPAARSRSVVDDSDDEAVNARESNGHVSPTPDTEGIEDIDVDPMIDVDEPTDTIETASSTATPSKRRRNDDSSLPDLDMHLSDIGDNDIDIAFDELPEHERERSVSVEPNVKRRKVTNRF